MLRRGLYEGNFELVRKGHNGPSESFHTFTQFLIKHVKKSLKIDLAELLPLLTALESALVSMSEILRTASVEAFKDYSKTECLSKRIEEVFLETLMSSGSLTCAVLESQENVIQGSHRGYYIGYFSAMDNEKDMAYSCGSVFAFAKCPEWMRKEGRQLKDTDVLLTGESIEFAGYCLHGCSTEMVFGLKGLGLHQFTLEENLGLFILSAKNVQIPKKAQFYFENGGNTEDWHEKITQILSTKISLTDRDLAYFNPGGYVSVLHAIIKSGGIYLQDEGNVPLLYGASPIAFLVKEGKGLNFTGDACIDVLKIQPTSLHMKIGMFCGSYIDIRLIKDIFQDKMVIIG